MSIWSSSLLEAEPVEAIFRALLAPTMPTALVVSTDPVDFARSVLPFELDAKQAEVLRSPAKYVALCCHRQWGKSQCAALKASHLAMNQPGAEIIIVAPSLRQSGALLRSVHQFLSRLDQPMKPDGLNRLSIVLPNGSRIVAVPNNGDTIRGFSGVNLLIIDEAAFITDETYRAVFPFLASSNGNLLLLSTPSGQSGFFYQAMHVPENNFATFRIRASESQRLSADLLEMARLELGDAYAQEFECEFAMGAEQMFDRSLIDQALDPVIVAFR